MGKDLIIRSSSAEFLIFERQTHDKGIQVRFEDGDLWLTQKAMSELYNCSSDNIGLHLKNIYNDLELDKNSTTEDFSVIQKEGKREVTRKIKYYNLDAVISVGYRVNSERAIQFRRWATHILKEFSKKGYIIDKKRMSNGAFFDEDYYVSAFLDLAEARAKRHIPMTMEDWATRIDKFLLSDDRDILKDAGKISHEIACDKALTEFEKYRIKQDKLYKSDFDLLMEETETYGSENNE